MTGEKKEKFLQLKIKEHVVLVGPSSQLPCMKFSSWFMVNLNKIYLKSMSLNAQQITSTMGIQAAVLEAMLTSLSIWPIKQDSQPKLISLT